MTPDASSTSSYESSSVASSVSSSASSGASSSGAQAPALDYGCRIPASPAEPEARPLLVVRVNYDDYAFRDSAAAWSEKIFGDEPHELNDYYEAVSYGRFRFEPAEESDGTQDGVVTVTLDKNHPEYDIGDNYDFYFRFHADLKAALQKTDPFVDYARYDTNENGAISPDELVIMFILSGSENAFSTNTDVPGVWAHQSCVSPQNAPTLDGTLMMGCFQNGNYAVFGERHIDDCDRLVNGQCIQYDHDATVGIIAHELGHATFGLPDLYDTSGASAGIGYFGLMGAGMWGQESASDLYANTPVSMTAWSKVVNGWIQPEIISEAADVPATFYDTASNNYNIGLLPIGSHECFLLENRSTEGYDAGLLNSIHSYYRGGLAVWHIDQEVIDAGMAGNIVNADAEHKGVDLEEAERPELDYSPYNPGDAHNLFWQGNATRFTETTDPGSQRYDGSDSGVRITGISATGPVMDAVITNPNKGNE